MPSALSTKAYADADSAPDCDTSRSTTGCPLMIAGPDARFLVSTVSKRHMAVSHSTLEADIVVALGHMVRTMVTPRCS